MLTTFVFLGPYLQIRCSQIRILLVKLGKRSLSKSVNLLIVAYADGYVQIDSRKVVEVLSYYVHLGYAEVQTFFDDNQHEKMKYISCVTTFYETQTLLGAPHLINCTKS